MMGGSPRHHENVPPGWVGASKPAGKPVWVPQPGSQTAFLSCPVFEVLYEGTRGPGKTDALLMDFAQHVGQGFGPEWRGVIFRQSYPQLADLIAKSQKWFRLIWGDAAQYNQAKSTWTFPDGEQLLFRQFDRPNDYWNYHGHAYPFIGWEELTTWPTDEGYRMMMSCCRSTVPGIPRKYRATTNPYGVGHNWVKARFRLPHGRSRVIVDAVGPDGTPEPPRVAIHGHLMENRILLDADPDYINRLRMSARNPNELRAWLEGSWDITSGGMFDDLWDGQVHVIPRIDPRNIPSGWRIDRAFDYGQSRPFSVGWYAESNGEPMTLPDGRVIGHVRGDLVRFAEWYGFTGKRNEGLNMPPTDIAQGIILRERRMGIVGRVLPGPADTSIFDPRPGSPNIAEAMRSQGVRWERAAKDPGSRSQGWQMIRERLQAVKVGAPDRPGLWVTEDCLQFIETVPVLPRDDKNPDDVHTDAEDHIGDELRYRVRRMRRSAGQRGF